MSDLRGRPDGPVPDLTRDIVPFLRAAFPETSPRSADDVPYALRRGAQLDLIDWLEQRLEDAAADVVTSLPPLDSDTDLHVR